MIITKIKLKNINQFHGSQEIDCAPHREKKVIVIQSPNKAGKTNFINALYWCFYGENHPMVDPNNSKSIKSKEARDTDDFGVWIDFNIKGEEYKIERYGTSESRVKFLLRSKNLMRILRPMMMSTLPKTK